MKNLFFWLSVVVMSLFVMHSAKAEGTVAAVSVKGWCFNTTSCAGYAASAEASCSANGWNGVGLAIIEGWQYQCLWNGGYYGTLTYAFNVSSSCPVNSTGTTTCTCDAGFQPDATAMACVAPACPSAGTVASSGYYDRGVNYDVLPPGIISGCFNNCGTTHQFIDPPSYRAKISGVYHYYSKGALVYDGGSCVAGSPATSATVDPTTVQQSCASGEVGVTSSAGVLNCYKDGSISGASAPVATTTSTSTTITTDPVTGASSVSVSTTIAETTGGSSGGTSGTPGVPEDLQDFCKSNPMSPMCKPSDEYELGDAPAAETLPSEEPVFSVSTVSFASVAGCPAPVSFEITGLPMISKSYSISWQPFCDVAAMLRPIFLAIAAITAAFIFAGVMI